MIRYILSEKENYFVVIHYNSHCNLQLLFGENNLFVLCARVHISA